jgi:hypothetical protein
MKLVTFNGVKFILTSDTSEALGELHRQMPAIMADVTGMRDSQSGDQKYFNRRGSWEIKEVFGSTTVMFYSKITSSGRKITKELTNIFKSIGPDLGFVYELGEVDHWTVGIDGMRVAVLVITHFWANLSKTWLTPSYLQEVPVEDQVPFPAPLMQPLISDTLNLFPLIELVQNPEDFGFDQTITQSVTGAYPGWDNPPSSPGDIGYYESINEISETTTMLGSILWTGSRRNNLRIDWEAICDLGVDAKVTYKEGVYDIENTGENPPTVMCNASTEAIEDDETWVKNHAWCSIAYVSRLSDNITVSGDWWSRVGSVLHIGPPEHWHLGVCECTLDYGMGLKEPSIVPPANRTDISGTIECKIGSENGLINTYVLAAAYVRGTGEDDRGQPTASVRIYSYKNDPVYIIVYADGSYPSKVIMYKYFAIYKEILYESDEFFTSGDDSLLHSIYDNEVLGVGSACAVAVEYINTIVNKFSYEEDDNKGNLVQDRAMIFNMEE